MAYIILAHKLPEQLHRLFLSLNFPGNIFIIHICRNTSKSDHQKVLQLFRNEPNVFFSKREDGSWGEFGIVQAVINAMEILERKKIDFEYVHVISGNDYPIKSKKYLDNFFKENYGRQFLWYLPVYDYIPLKYPEGFTFSGKGYGYKHPWGATHRFLRFEKYWIRKFSERLMVVPEERFLNKPVWRVLQEFVYLIPKYFREKKLKREFLLIFFSIYYKEPRKIPEHFKPFAGSQWFSISRDCMFYVLKTIREKPEIKNFFKHTLLSDESFFTTILVHSPFKEKIAQDNLRFIKWPDEPPQNHPKILEKNDLIELKNSDKLFARKFDIGVDNEILDLIDTEILKISKEADVA